MDGACCMERLAWIRGSTKECAAWGGQPGSGPSVCHPFALLVMLTHLRAAGGAEYAGGERPGRALALREPARVVQLPRPRLHGLREAGPQPVRLPAAQRLQPLPCQHGAPALPPYPRPLTGRDCYHPARALDSPFPANNLPSYFMTGGGPWDDENLESDVREVTPLSCLQCSMRSVQQRLQSPADGTFWRAMGARGHCMAELF